MRDSLNEARQEYAEAKLRSIRAEEQLDYARPETIIEQIDTDQAAMDARDRYFRLKIEAERREPDEQEWEWNRLR